MTRAEFADITATLTTDIKALLDQMSAWTGKVYNNNANNRNNPNRGGEPIPVIRVCNNIPIIVTYRKLKYADESDLEYYERRYYNKLTDDYYEIEISDSVYRCPFCYNKDYSLSDLLRHASRIADNSRKTVKDIARHSILITYILRILTTLKEEIDVARTTEAFPTSVKPVEEHSVTEPVVSIVETDEHMVSQTSETLRSYEQRRSPLSTS
ncbi:putative Zinc finger-XS domain-containing protein [Medicago truncatula]|uniref:Putative Zinc finger-XS domain-containing protein n=1 Tax=Medicago truncatula TaxID=3880 RepID=A0A396GSS1_MEDTR|nr:putative Zinc finger-XS domain-containing protein [Medicago truncatula]